MTDIKEIIRQIKVNRNDVYYPFELFEMADVRGDARYEKVHLTGIVYVLFVEDVLTQDEYVAFTEAPFTDIMKAVRQLREEA